MYITIQHEIQTLLKSKGYYQGEIDGKAGPATLAAITALLDLQASKWPTTRKLIAAEQTVYKAQGIEVGVIDGLVGPATTHARELYAAKLTATWRDKTEDISAANSIISTPASSIIKPVWPLQRNVESFYGSVGTNQTKLIMPFPLRIAWDLKSTVKSYSCHEKVVDSMQRVWQRTFDEYGHAKIKELGLDLFGGCLNVRKMRGGSSWSTHAWGISIDIDPERNSLHTSWKNSQMSKPAYAKFVQFWYDEGFINLGKEANYDSMHHQAARLR